MELRKVPADSVPYGESITRNGKYVFAAFHSGVRVAVGVDRVEARDNYRDWFIAQSAATRAKKAAVILET